MVERELGGECHPRATLKLRSIRRQADFGGLVARAEKGAIGGVEFLEYGAIEGQGLAAGCVEESATERARGRREAQFKLCAGGADLVARADRDRIGDPRGERTPKNLRLAVGRFRTG